MRVVIDTETDGLENPKNIWLIVCKNIETGEFNYFRNVTSDGTEREKFHQYCKQDIHWIGHNILGYDLPVLHRLLDLSFDPVKCTDTLIISKMADYPRKGDSGGDDKKKHSIEAYGEEFTYHKGLWCDFSKWSQGMEDYCVRDVDIAHRVYDKYIKFINNASYQSAIVVEHKFQLIANSLHNNGFAFDLDSARNLLVDVSSKLGKLDKQILTAFPPKLKLIREITPRETKHGTLNKADFRFVTDGDLSVYNGGPFCRCDWSEFNPASHKQVIDVLHNAGWQPINKTKTRIDLEREVARSKFSRVQTDPVVLAEMKSKLENLEKYGWKIDETNIATLPDHAPKPARLLAQRILFESRRRTLKEWLSLVHLKLSIKKDSIITTGGVRITDDVSTTSNITTDLLSTIMIEWLKSKNVNAKFAGENDPSLLITITPQDQQEGYCAGDVIVALDGLKVKGLKYSRISERIKGNFFTIGAWTHRMAHQNPNTANIPNATDLNGLTKLYGKEMRSLWIAPKKRLLVGVDAEGIQLRIFAHYINDPEFTDALVTGDKKLKTDPHSLNQRIMGSVCKSRAASKRFIFAYLLGAGIGKLAEILGSSKADAEIALARLYERYSGFQKLKEEVIPRDAKRGYFIGLDGRPVRIIGNDAGTRRHLCMSGYLQNGEKVVMSHATVRFAPLLEDLDSFLVNLVHDEWQTETPNNMKIALQVAQLQSESLRIVGEELKLNCPLAGSYWNDDNKDYTIGVNWYQTH